MLCRGCDYRLDPAGPHRCPECGHAFDPADPKSWAVRSRLQRRVRAVGLTAGAAGLGFASLALAVGTVVIWALVLGFALSWRELLLLTATIAITASAAPAAALASRIGRQRVNAALALGTLAAAVAIAIAAVGSNSSNLLAFMLLTPLATTFACLTAFFDAPLLRRAMALIVSLALLIAGPIALHVVAKALAIEREVQSIGAWADASRDELGRPPIDLAGYTWLDERFNPAHGLHPGIRSYDRIGDLEQDWVIYAGFFDGGEWSAFHSDGTVFHSD